MRERGRKEEKEGEEYGYWNIIINNSIIQMGEKGKGELTRGEGALVGSHSGAGKYRQARVPCCYQFNPLSKPNK